MGAATSLATLGLSYAVGRQKQKRENELTAAEAQIQAADIRARERALRKRDEALLKARLASQRARAGAGGTATGGGSIDAVLRGLTEQTRMSISERKRDADRQIAALGTRSQLRQRNNLLDFDSDFLGRSAGTAARLGRDFSLLD